MSLRPYQEAPVAWLASRKRGLVVAPAGSGKTVMAAAALDRVLAAKPRPNKVLVGWVANTQEQCSQANLALDLFPELRRCAAVTVRCAAAACDWSGYSLLIVDEAHHAAAPGWKEQIETCQGARWGFTATPDAEGEDAEDRDAALRELFGEERFVVDRAEVGSLVAKAQVRLLEASDEGCGDEIGRNVKKLLSRFTYYKRKELADAEARFGRGSQQARSASGLLAMAEKEMYPRAAWLACVETGIVGNAARNAKAADVAAAEVARGESVLVLVNQVEHAKWFAELVGAVACYSGMGAKARRHALHDFKAGKLRCVVATSLADEGLDVPRAGVLVLVSGGRSRAKAEQRTGRVLRAFAGKERGVIYDFADTFHPLMRKHAEARQSVYRELGYEIERNKYAY